MLAKCATFLLFFGFPELDTGWKSGPCVCWITRWWYHGAPTPSLSLHGTDFISPAPCGSGVVRCRPWPVVVCPRQHPGDWKVAKDGRTAVEDWVLRKLSTTTTTTTTQDKAVGVISFMSDSLFHFSTFTDIDPGNDIPESFYWQMHSSYWRTCSSFWPT
jgi:hypothetical protein